MGLHRISVLDKSMAEEYALSEPNERKGADQDAEGLRSDGRPDGQEHVYLYVYLYVEFGSMRSALSRLVWVTMRRGSGSQGSLIFFCAGKEDR